MGRHNKKGQHRLKKQLQELLDNMDSIPGRFLPQRLSFGHGVVLDTEKRHVCFFTDKGKVNEYNLDTFFRHHQLDEHDTKRVLTALKDYMLILKEQEGKLKARDIIECENADIRRYLLGQFGFDAFVERLNAKTIHSDGTSRLLFLQYRSDAEPMVMVKVVDSSTGEVYLLRVPPGMRTCRQAVAWTFEMEEDDYTPLAEA